MTEITMQFSDGNYRWSIIATPTGLKNLLEERDMEPGIWATHMIVVRSLAVRDIGVMLAQLNSEGELLEASRPYPFEELSEANYEWFAALQQ